MAKLYIVAMVTPLLRGTWLKNGLSALKPLFFSHQMVSKHGFLIQIHDEATWDDPCTKFQLNWMENKKVGIYIYIILDQVR